MTVIHFTLLFPGPVHLDLGDAIPAVACVPTVSSLLSIISDAMKKYSTQMVRKRKYRRYLDNYVAFVLMSFRIVSFGVMLFSIMSFGLLLVYPFLIY